MKSAESYKIELGPFDNEFNITNFIREIQKDAYNSGLQTAYEAARNVFYHDDVGLETFQACIDGSKKT